MALQLLSPLPSLVSTLASNNLYVSIFMMQAKLKIEVNNTTQKNKYSNIVKVNNYVLIKVKLSISIPFYSWSLLVQFI